MENYTNKMKTYEEARDYIAGWLSKSEDVNGYTKQQIINACHNAISQIDCEEDGLDAYLRMRVGKIPEECAKGYEAGIEERDYCREEIQAEVGKYKSIIDIIIRELEGDDPALLANDYGGTGLDTSEEVTRARKAMKARLK